MASNLSFLLKGVDLQKLTTDYHQGKFNRPVPELAPIKFSPIENFITPGYTDNPADDIYRTRGRYGQHMIMVTTNCDNYRRKLQHIPEKQGGRCQNCLQDFTHQALGHPVAYEEKIIHHNGQQYVVHCFWVENCYCCYECALSYIRRTLGPALSYRHDHLRDSESLLHFLFYLQNGKDKILEPTPDPRLLKENGGSMDRDEWSRSGTLFIPSSNRILLPAKSTFIKTP